MRLRGLIYPVEVSLLLCRLDESVVLSGLDRDLVEGAPARVQGQLHRGKLVQGVALRHVHLFVLGDDEYIRKG